MAIAIGDVGDILAKHFGALLQVEECVSAERMTTFQLGGLLRYVVTPQSIEALQALVYFLESEGVKWRVIGFGSNLLVGDRGLEDEVVIHLGAAFRRVATCAEPSCLAADISSLYELWAGGGDAVPNCSEQLVFGGYPLVTFAKRSARAGWRGLEFAAGIPGSFGGAVRMNAGAHGSEMSKVVQSVVLVLADGSLKVLEGSDLVFAYRRLALPEKAIVVAARIRLTPDDPALLQRELENGLTYRKRTQPLQMPSAGSIFRNPQEVAVAMEKGSEMANGERLTAGYLLEHAELKGVSINGVRYSELHANWIVKVGKDSKSEDVDRLIKLGQDRVKERFGVSLETELVRW